MTFSAFPVLLSSQYRNHVLHLVEKFQTLVIVGETGCGKSTQVSAFGADCQCLV